MKSADSRRFIYRVNAQDKLCFVNSDWMSFAEENGASHLAVDTVIGLPLLEFIEGMETQHLYELLMNRVREHQQVLEVPFRCDGPTVRRFMKLRISPLLDSCLQFEGWSVSEQQRQQVALIDTTVRRSDQFLVICSWCKQVKISDMWIEVEEAIERLKLFDRDDLPQLTHGMCFSCNESVQREIDQFERQM